MQQQGWKQQGDILRRLGRRDFEHIHREGMEAQNLRVVPRGYTSIGGIGRKHEARKYHSGYVWVWCGAAPPARRLTIRTRIEMADRGARARVTARIPWHVSRSRIRSRSQIRSNSEAWRRQPCVSAQWPIPLAPHIPPQLLHQRCCR